MPSTRARTFVITGVSSGFGRAIAEGALARGHVVVGTVRGAEAAEAFERLCPGRAHARQHDVTDLAAAAPLVAALESEIGPVDVLINNAGYGHEGVLEESPIEELLRQFQVNVFGAVAMMKAVLPFMRPRRAGRIFNTTSMGGFITMPGIAYYCGSKFALEGISETLGKEVAAFGIGVTAIAPGSFRTDWAGRSMVRSDRGIADYDALFDPIRARRQAVSGRQLGDPARAARVIVDLAVGDAMPPAHLLLGSDAVGLVEQKLGAMGASIEAWRAVSGSTDAPLE
ncbi:oxidoreductase [Mitsuaria sp. GD03876]|uniref:oxidoreductase n=1 Tax=Mitsuaria sp. GD03876 TaxID=2975399 RepID=UPI00244817C8|nr:oxidoreductase [Mitsuaria sp. GD03876]MDH0866369.1 oxidoreductase [Mitsuaria sp. GD03876]